MARGQLINRKEMLALKAVSANLDAFMYHFTNFALSRTNAESIDDPRIQQLVKLVAESAAVKQMMELKGANPR